MPMYEYFCPDCNVRFEKLVRRATPENAEGGVACPTCDHTDTRRVLSVIAAPVFAGAAGAAGASMSMDGRSQASGGCCGGGGCGCGHRNN